MPTQANYNPSNNPNSLVFDSSLRTISNLLVDQTLGNPAAILEGLARAGSDDALIDLPLITAIYLVTRLEEETRHGKGGTMAAQLSGIDLTGREELGYRAFRSEE